MSWPADLDYSRTEAMDPLEEEALRDALEPGDDRSPNQGDEQAEGDPQQ